MTDTLQPGSLLAFVTKSGFVPAVGPSGVLYASWRGLPLKPQPMVQEPVILLRCAPDGDGIKLHLLSAGFGTCWCWHWAHVRGIDLARELSVVMTLQDEE